MAYSNQVHAIMLNAILFNITPIPVATGGGTVTRQPVGQPEHIPEITFIAGPITGDPFLEAANSFHSGYNLTLVEVTSFQQVLNHLRNPTGTIDRIRIVSHADSENISLPFFDNDVLGVKKEQLTEFANSDVEGMKALISHYSSSSSEYIFPNDATAMFLTFLRTHNTAELQPFDLANPPSTEEGDFIRRCIDIWFINNATITIQTQNDSGGVTGTRQAGTSDKDVFRATVTSILDSIMTSLIGQPIPGSSPPATVTQEHLNDLRDAITAVPVGSPAPSGTQRNALLVGLTATNAAIAGGIRTTINTVKARFTTNSTIDIRGCEAGKDDTYMDAVRTFMGTAGNLPKVTAPEWFQSFPFAVTTVGFDTPANIDSLARSGWTTRAGASDVTAAFTLWKNLVAFDPHFTFLQSLFSGSKLDFLKLNWRSWRSGSSTTGFPILNMSANEIESFVNAPSPTVSTSITQLGNLVALDSSHLPTPQVLARIESLLPHITSFDHLELQFNSLPDEPSTDWSALYGAIGLLAGAITGIAGFPPPSTTPLVPTNASPTHDDVQDALTAVNQHIIFVVDTDLGTYFSEMTSALTTSNGALRYYFMSGLPMLIQKKIGGNHTMSFVLAIWGAGTVRDNALRSWMKIQWTGTPQQETDMNNHINGLSFDWDAATGNLSNFSRVARVVQTGGSSSRAESSPLVEYQSHIQSRP